MSYKTLLLILVFGISTSCGKDPDKVQLLLKLQKDQTYKMQLSDEQKIFINDKDVLKGSQEQGTEIAHHKIDMEYTFNVEKVDTDGTVTLKITYNSIHYKSKGPLGDVEYDSTTPEPPIHPIIIWYSALKGRSFTVSLFPYGHIKDISGLDEIQKNLSEKIEQLKDPIRDIVKQNLEKEPRQQEIKENIEKLFAIYPVNPVGIGDSWVKKVVLSRFLPVTLNNNWTLIFRKDGVSTIQTDSSIEFNEKEKLSIEGMSISYAIKGKHSGNIDIDEATGWILQGEITQELNGDVNLDGIDFPVLIKGSVTIETIKN